jgi:hypothetical protein
MRSFAGSRRTIVRGIAPTRAASRARVNLPTPTYEQMLENTLNGFRKQGKELTRPLRVLAPEDDVCENTRRVQPLIDSGKIRNARIHDIPGWTHGQLEVHTVEMADVVRRFVDA